MLRDLKKRAWMRVGVNAPKLALHDLGSLPPPPPPPPPPLLIIIIIIIIITIIITILNCRLQSGGLSRHHQLHNRHQHHHHRHNHHHFNLLTSKWRPFVPVTMCKCKIIKDYVTLFFCLLQCIFLKKIFLCKFTIYVLLTLFIWQLLTTCRA